MSNIQLRRMWVVAICLGFAGLVLIGRLFAFQVFQKDDFIDILIEDVPVTAQSERGVIYDRNGATLAVDRWEYRVAVSPGVLSNREELATALAPILQKPRSELLYKMDSSAPYVILEPRAPAEAADAIRQIKNGDEVQLEPLPRRYYPQGSLMCHVLGYVNFSNEGGAGVEGYYQKLLAGESVSDFTAFSPLREQKTVVAHEGADLVLTIDRSVQYVVEQHLKDALAEYGAVSGSIIVMNPKTGAILAMAAEPCYSPNEFNNLPEGATFNPLVSAVFEPGSVMKLITMAAALDSGTVTPETTYNDTGAIEVGGHVSYNWDRSAYGTVDMTTLLAHSLNVGAVTIATWMGENTFYDYFSRFGFGRPTNVDIMSESAGLMPVPGDSGWETSFLATNAYGQSLAVTPLQMISAVSALANGGVRMEPYVVEEIRDQNGIRRHKPESTRVISETTAAQMTAMATNAVSQETQGAMVPGYTVAGKTGTAQIAEPFGGYNPTDIIGTFVGWLPVEDPQIIVYVKLDRPKSAEWGSMTAAPAFADLVKELVVLLDIPPDAVRLQANNTAGGGS
ncbi:MAG TPA: penicillin-binding protein 2 [Promineifilum sp.]|nr:penicillin-binding protein 2 [Promineifilum sp.]